MIDLYYAATPDSRKIRLFLEEAGQPYRLIQENQTYADALTHELLDMSPNSKIPMMVDYEPEGGGVPLAVFEPGAMLLYLADKLQQLVPVDVRGRTEVLKWLFWQTESQGHVAPEAHAQSDHLVQEVQRLYGVLDEQLWGRDFLAGAYSIADIACYPWIIALMAQGHALAHFPDLKRWHAGITQRPAVRLVYADH